MAREDMETAEKANELFASVFATENIGQIPEPALIVWGKESEQLKPTEIRKEDILAYFEKLHSNKSMDPDCFYRKVFKELRCTIAELLAKICDLSFKSGTVPKDWKVINDTAIVKKGLSEIW